MYFNNYTIKTYNFGLNGRDLIIYACEFIIYDGPNKCQCLDEPIGHHHPHRPGMDNEREAIKRAFNIPDDYKSARRPLGYPSKSTLNEPKSVTKEALIPP